MAEYDAFDEKGDDAIYSEVIDALPKQSDIIWEGVFQNDISHFYDYLVEKGNSITNKSIFMPQKAVVSEAANKYDVSTSLIYNRVKDLEELFIKHRLARFARSSASGKKDIYEYSSEIVSVIGYYLRIKKHYGQASETMVEYLNRFEEQSKKNRKSAKAEASNTSIITTDTLSEFLSNINSNFALKTDHIITQMNEDRKSIETELSENREVIGNINYDTQKIAGEARDLVKEQREDINRQREDINRLASKLDELVKQSSAAEELERCKTDNAALAEENGKLSEDNKKLAQDNSVLSANNDDLKVKIGALELNAQRDAQKTENQLKSIADLQARISSLESCLRSIRNEVDQMGMFNLKTKKYYILTMIDGNLH